ncbi:MAG: type IV pilus modification protein PilV [Gammaproteobacteria bacterium]|nr:type IV pilus modification protein PilV [Gammaproteobacteria bacterium]
MMKQYKKIAFCQRGFSLIEALVAFLILSVGMLGIASLQLLSLKAGHTATLRTVAVIKTEEMFERIRNNPVVLDPDEVGSYDAAILDLGDNNGCHDHGVLNICTSAELARDDIYNWKADLRNSLPNNAGTTASIGVVDRVPGIQPTATVTITVNWQERNPETLAMDTMSYSVSAHICDNTKC